MYLFQSFQFGVLLLLELLDEIGVGQVFVCILWPLLENALKHIAGPLQSVLNLSIHTCYTLEEKER